MDALLGLLFLSLVVSSVGTADESTTTCLPLCCQGSVTANASSSCASVLVVDGGGTGASCRELFGTVDTTSSKPVCSSGDAVRKVRLSKPIMIRARKLTPNLLEAQLNVRSGYISNFYNVNSSSHDVVHPPPLSYCPTQVDSNGLVVRALACPRLRLKATRITKCCPFGQELQFPSEDEGRCAKLTGIMAQGSAGGSAKQRKWYLRMNGFRLHLQHLVRFPYVNVLHDPDRTPWRCRRQGDALAVDYETFQFNKRGHLTFTRLLGRRVMSDDFCVDSLAAVRTVTVRGPVRKRTEERTKYFMAALFCAPANFTGEISRLRNNIWPASGSPSPSPSLLILVTVLLCNMLPRPDLFQ